MDAVSDAFNRTIHNITYHEPKHDVTQDLMGNIRAGAKDFITVICRNTQYCRETQMAYTHIEEAVMNAIAGLARYEEESLTDLVGRGQIHESRMDK